jgi:hypothetical protein
MTGAIPAKAGCGRIGFTPHFLDTDPVFWYDPRRRKGCISCWRDLLPAGFFDHGCDPNQDPYGSSHGTDA